jgi:CheY-like chemotaxis protein
MALVVDDSLLVRHSVCRFLEQRGFLVEAATNGAEALEVLGKLRPDIIITDLLMPKMTGGELITAVKRNPETAAIPIVILSRQGSSYPKDSDAQFVINKDIDIEEQLEKAISALCGA